VSIETVKESEKRIPGGIYHRFVEERARQLGALSTDLYGFIDYTNFYISHDSSGAES
jgi:hypothetical protein